ncbi:MAG: DUF3536 domain-containing protein [Bryobacteraceae bacterium]
MKYVCIHGHFYQPPRENPWLEAIELQDSAYPYHDWNERITAECYAPNAATRILDGDGRIEKIVNNYSRISFNFGPTLLSWAETSAPELYQLILSADKESQTLYSGHGSAIAQAYNHMIMPLANSRDKRTQVIWGIEDFKYRFKRDPEGMWLPETAVDLETLDILAEQGIRYTILAPHQAHLVRKIGRAEWIDVTGGRIDPKRPYRLTTPSGRTISIFFYDGPISRAVAFEGLLNNGEEFARRVLTAFSEDKDSSGLAHIATDGESYGHHHRYGEMALSYAMHHVEAQKLAKLTNYGEYLAMHPPAHEVEIYENTAWSCAHGVGRWISNCGCNSGGRGGWNQEWRGPLRSALDWLRDEVAPRYEKQLGVYLRDPWEARNDYIQVVLDRAEEVREAFLARHSVTSLNDQDKVRVWKLLELQRHAMLMYTSCGWFFDELSGIETVQVIQYAGRVVQLAQELLAESTKKEGPRAKGRAAHKPVAQTLEDLFLERLAHAKSNLPEHRDGAHMYERLVKPAMVDLRKVGAHYAISSLFEPYPKDVHVYCYTAVRDDLRTRETGRMRLALGKAQFISEVTQEKGLITFGVLHFGDHNLNGGVREFQGEGEYENLVQAAMQAFSRADIPEVIRQLDKGFGAHTYSLKSLFKDERRKILDEILNSTLEEAETAYRQLYENHAPLMRFLRDLPTPLPKAFRTTAEYALNSYLRRAFASEDLDIPRIQSILDEARIGEVDLDATTLEYTLRQKLESLARTFAKEPADLVELQRLAAGVSLLSLLPFTVTLWSVQNVCYELLQTRYRSQKRKAHQGDPDAQAWVGHFKRLAHDLCLHVD